MTGLVLLLLGGMLVGVTAVAVAAALPLESRSSRLAAVFVVGWLDVVLVSLALSPFRWFGPAGLLAGLALACCVALVLTRRHLHVVGDTARGVVSGLRTTIADPLVATLGGTVALAFAYALVLQLWTPQNDFDTIYDHLWRAGLWVERHAIGYPDCSCAPYINAYPPTGEIGPAVTMALGGHDRYVALPQATAFLALAVGVVGIGRRLGLERGPALFGGLVAATLPVIALQSSTAQNDLVLAAFLVAAALFLLERGPAAPWLAAAATALAVSTKVSAAFGVPLLLVIALLARQDRARLARVGAVVAGTLVGSWWYWVNRHQTGSLTGGFPDIPVDHGVLASLSRVTRFAILFVDVPGARGRDLLLYAVAGLVVAALVMLARRGRPREALLVGGVVLGVAILPLAWPELATTLERVHVKLWRVLGRDDLAYVDIGRDIRRSASNVSWYGPLGTILLVVGIWASIRAVRRRSVDRLAIVFALSPLYWVVAFGLSLYYQDAAGRFFMFAMALAAATWGLVLAWRPLAWGMTAIAVTAVALALLNDTKRPSGLRLLEPAPPTSYFRTPRWAGQGAEARAAELTRFIDETLPTDAVVALSITPSDPGYLFFGRGLDRRLPLIDGSTRDVPEASWAFSSPLAGATSLCPGAWDRLDARPQGWTVLRRIPGGAC